MLKRVLLLLSIAFFCTHAFSEILTNEISLRRSLGLFRYSYTPDVDDMAIVVLDTGFGTEEKRNSIFPDCEVFDGSTDNPDKKVANPELLDPNEDHGLRVAMVIQALYKDHIKFYFVNGKGTSGIKRAEKVVLEKAKEGKRIPIAVDARVYEYGSDFNGNGPINAAWREFIDHTGILAVGSASNAGLSTWDDHVHLPHGKSYVQFDGKDSLEFYSHVKDAKAMIVVSWSRNSESYKGTDADLDAYLYRREDDGTMTLVSKSEVKQRLRTKEDKDLSIPELQPVEFLKTSVEAPAFDISVLAPVEISNKKEKSVAPPPPNSGNSPFKQTVPPPPVPDQSITHENGDLTALPSPSASTLLFGYKKRYFLYVKAVNPEKFKPSDRIRVTVVNSGDPVQLGGKLVEAVEMVKTKGASIMAPGDNSSPNFITVGSDTPFSGKGPTTDGRRKPEVIMEGYTSLASFADGHKMLGVTWSVAMFAADLAKIYTVRSDITGSMIKNWAINGLSPDEITDVNPNSTAELALTINQIAPLVELVSRNQRKTPMIRTGRYPDGRYVLAISCQPAELGVFTDLDPESGARDYRYFYNWGVKKEERVVVNDFFGRVRETFINSLQGSPYSSLMEKEDRTAVMRNVGDIEIRAGRTPGVWVSPSPSQIEGWE